MTNKIITLLAGVCLATTNVHAQQYEELPGNEISVSYGFGPAYYIGVDLSRLFSNIFTAPLSNALGEDIKYDETKCLGSFNIDYNHHINPVMAFGINASYCRLESDLLSDKKCIGQDKMYCYAVMPNAKFEWLRRKYVTMYSRVSAGVLFVHEETDNLDSNYNNGNHKEVTSDNSTCFMVQISPFGIEAGSENLRGFYEVGFGQAGIVQLGIRARF